MATSRDERLVFLDLLKTVASHLIVLHHLCFYGPMSEVAHPLAPRLIDWLGDKGRFAVQVFLVISGFMLARALSGRDAPGLAGTVKLVARRAAKLVPPYFAAVLLAVLAAFIARHWISHDSIPPAPTLPQLAAHAVLLQSVLGFDGLSAGAWYIAIDLQLYAVMLFLLLACRRQAADRHAMFAPLLVAGATGASLLYFNRDPAWDAWAPYFIGSYGFGMLAWWAGESQRSARGRWLLIGIMLALALIAQAVDFRGRILLALAIAAALMLTRGETRFGTGHAPVALLRFGGRISYSLFLVHFPVCMVVNAGFMRFAPHQPAVQAIGMIAAWGLSVTAAVAFQRRVEAPLGSFASGLLFKPASRAAQPATADRRSATPGPARVRHAD
ncbi:Peptidoglycan/LPS O-acetylase OafA/YrhL, contains acyltransferase and SGNH-hydrolase domains [Noviherbaspirillum humi]|uniref:Peptidoglycan/LPS O-acetylase OafA/YrhL, contains acyltransferase and SGNH-hydrolase domains n=1 Tax=Noviherbaspirillum humi TaxID=1688639 RepID=A0A239E8B6_9BURK|nr:acyltransferase [Noviherbaspirillum humi]SNS40538.1 Peptidoglycan/LPS O-acetylase OafA/YrhL, contains acyltransferase and SGNH-hydrolase domains [Noviherbaspirillum humi]